MRLKHPLHLRAKPLSRSLSCGHWLLFLDQKLRGLHNYFATTTLKARSKPSSGIPKLFTIVDKQRPKTKPPSLLNHSAHHPPSFKASPGKKSSMLFLPQRKRTWRESYTKWLRTWTKHESRGLPLSQFLSPCLAICRFSELVRLFFFSIPKTTLLSVLQTYTRKMGGT
jgi:hypothetical protein